jgi:hypothetical protein
MRISAMTVVTESARNIEWQYDLIALLDAGNRFTYFFDHAHDLVPDNRSFLPGRPPVVHMKTASTDAARRHSQ